MSNNFHLTRVRIHYHKTQPLRYTGTLDIHKIWERTLRRARIPLAYSQGFHPQPRINQALPLPLGLTSRAELMDIWLEEPCTAEDVLQNLRTTLHPGLVVQNINIVALDAPKLQKSVLAAEYSAILLDPIPDLKTRIDQLLAADKLLRQRRKKTYDLRPLIETLAILPLDESGCQCINMRLTASEGATGRADEVILALSIQPHDTRIERTDLHLKPGK
jgi:radical SAM-linked protein